MMWLDDNAFDAGAEMMANGREFYTINNRRDAAGWIGQTAIVWRRGLVTEIGYPANAGAYALNESGDVVGEMDGQAFIWSRGSLTMLPRLPGSIAGCAAYGVNDQGTVVGGCGGSYAVIWTRKR